MTTRQAEDTQAQEEALSDEAVAAYLEAHPEFFERQPDLVARLLVPHGSGGAVSLIEHQVGVLRGQLDTERRRLAHLIARARDYETLSARLHGLVLQLIAAPDVEFVTAVLQDALCKEFNAEAVTLKLFPLEPELADADPLVSAFMGFVDREHSLCGPADADHNGVLFGEHGEAIQSAALIPVRANSRSGVLAIGSSDPERFTVDMGTDLLDRLGEIVSQKLMMLHRGHG
ncbi:MAG: DUF484 family protein [Pseudomonadota bacterium]|nr:DUF484 family protein [Pseudomonadota bacterium]